MDKKQIYESIMRTVSYQVKKALNEASAVTAEQKMMRQDIINAIDDYIDWLDEDEKIEATNNMSDPDSHETRRVLNRLYTEEFGGYEYSQDFEEEAADFIFDAAMAMQKFDFDVDKVMEYFEII